MLNFVCLHPKITIDHLGLIPSFLNTWDKRPAAQQIDAHYQHGGGWRPISKFKLVKEPSPLLMRVSPYRLARELVLQYPDDPPLEPFAVAQLRDETIVFYDGAFLAIFQPDYTFEISRVD
jgi:hypothetical protein